MLYSRRRSICQTDCGRAYSEKSNLHLGPRTDHGGGTSFAPFGLGEVARWPKFLKGAKLSKRSGGAEPLKCDVHPFRFFFRGTCLQRVLPAARWQESESSRHIRAGFFGPASPQ